MSVQSTHRNETLADLQALEAEWLDRGMRLLPDLLLILEELGEDFMTLRSGVHKHLVIPPAQGTYLLDAYYTKSIGPYDPGKHEFLEHRVITIWAVVNTRRYCLCCLVSGPEWSDEYGPATFVMGQWIDRILASLPLAQEKRQRRLEDANAAQYTELRNRLLLDLEGEL